MATPLASTIEVTTRLFSWQDYLVFALMLAISSIIGLYHGFRMKMPWSRGSSSSQTLSEVEGASSKSAPQGPSNDSPEEFLTGRGKMGTFPVALSMLASFLSSITLMGQPAEVYLFGSQLWLFGFATFLAIPFTNYVMIPFFHKMKVTSAYQYFGIRFDRRLQLLASLLFTVQMVLYLALVLYAPALALHQVTGLNTMVVVTAMYIVCIFYTTIGGMKAVVWTDTFQVIVLYAAMFAVLIKGTIQLGGVDAVWAKNAEMGRANLFNWSLSPMERYSVWSTFVGAAILHASVYGANQLQVQRYFTVPSVKEARKMIWINCVGWTLVVLLTVYAGMLIFAKYASCDPISSHMVSKADQLFPLFVMDIAGEFVGFPGLFVAGIFSAGLSTVSTGLNSLAAIWYSELEGTTFKAKLTERQGGYTVKMLALLFGLLSFSLVFAVPYMSGLVPVAIALSSFFSGSLFGLFLIGMFVPFANTIGATAGLISGIGVVGWMTIGAQISEEAGKIVSPHLPLSTEGCVHINSTIMTITSTPLPEREYAFDLYRVSFLWYSTLSLIITLVVGVTVSFVTNLCRNKSCAPESQSSSISWTAGVVHRSIGEVDDGICRPEKLLVGSGDKDSHAIKGQINPQIGDILKDESEKQPESLCVPS